VNREETESTLPPATQTATQSVIRSVGLHVSFGGRAVLTGVDLGVSRARSTVLIGPSSSGKTVFMKCVAGLIEPEAGRIEIEGRDTARLTSAERESLADKISMVFQRNALFDSLSVWENVAFRPIHNHGMGRGEARAMAIEKLAMFGLRPDVADRFPVEISGGMQKRVALARAFATDPDILLLDAPTDGLDPIMTHATNDLIRRAVQRGGTTVLSITGDMRAALAYYDDLAMLHEGRIVWSGTTAEAAQSDDPRLHQLLSGKSDGPIALRARA
jgi:phospholipid/cholesterol/gamma-HCH transport system ATP-binding protein